MIIGLTYDLPLNLQEQYNDFAVLAQILITTLQMPDSLSDSLILANVPFIQSIAIQEHHIAQSDAKSLLEQAGHVQEYKVFVPDGTALKMQKQITPEIVDINVCDELNVYPNPSEGIFLVKYSLDKEFETAEIKFTSSDGKNVESYKLTELASEIKINCKSCITGSYLITLYTNGEILCSCAVHINK